MDIESSSAQLSYWKNMENIPCLKNESEYNGF